MEETLSTLVVALAAKNLVLMNMEAKSAREKVGRLKTIMAGKEYKDKMPFNIDTRAKAYATGLVLRLSLLAGFWGLFMVLDLSIEAELWTSLSLLVVAALSGLANFHEYHVDIEQITRPVKDKVQNS